MRPGGGDARAAGAARDRFFMLHGLATDGHLVVRLRGRARLDVLSTAAASAYSGSLAGARLTGMLGAPRARLVASLLGRPGARGYVVLARAPAPGAAAEVQAHVFGLRIESGPWAVELRVPVAAAPVQPLMKAAFEELFCGVSAWQAAAFALAEEEQDFNAFDGDDDGDEGDSGDDEDESGGKSCDEGNLGSGCGDVGRDGAASDAGVELSGREKRMEERCEQVLTERTKAIRDGLSVELPVLGTKAFACSRLPSLYRRLLLADAEKQRKEKEAAAARKAEQTRRREAAAAAAAAAAAGGESVAREEAVELSGTPASAAGKRAPAAGKRARAFDVVVDDSDDEEMTAALRRSTTQGPVGGKRARMFDAVVDDSDDEDMMAVQSQNRSLTQGRTQRATQSQTQSRSQSQVQSQGNAGATGSGDEVKEKKKKKKKKKSKTKLVPII